MWHTPPSPPMHRRAKWRTIWSVRLDWTIQVSKFIALSINESFSGSGNYWDRGFRVFCYGLFDARCSISNNIESLWLFVTIFLNPAKGYFYYLVIKKVKTEELVNILKTKEIRQIMLHSNFSIYTYIIQSVSNYMGFSGCSWI